jgi:hypothetical protein
MTTQQNNDDEKERVFAFAKVGNTKILFISPFSIFLPLSLFAD